MCVTEPLWSRIGALSVVARLDDPGFHLRERQEIFHFSKHGQTCCGAH